MERSSAGPCRVGKSALSHVPEAPALWKEGPGRPIVLACLRDRDYAGAAIVGYVTPGHESCVTAYNPRFKEGIERLCEIDGSPWTMQCEGAPGCIHTFFHSSDSTQIDGPMEARVRRIRVSIDGRPFESGVAIAHVGRRLGRSIATGESFGYFAVFIHSCVVPDQVRMEFLGAGGALLGKTHGWDAVVPPCAGAGREGRPG